MIPLGVLASARVSSTLTFTYQTAAVDSVDRTAYTFSAQAIGTAATSRRVVVAISWRYSSPAPAISSVTIGGVSATVHASVMTGDGGSNAVAIASAVVPTGTSADVVVTFASTSTRCGIGVWTLPNGGSYTGQSAGAQGNTNLSVDVTTVAGQGVIAAVMSLGSSTATSTWTGADERYDAAIEGTNIYHSGADRSATSTTTTVQVATNNLTQHSLIAAAFSA